MMILPVLVMLFVCILMPLGFAWRIWRLDEATRGAWLLLTADALVFVALIMLVGRWDMAGYYIRYFLLALVAGAVLASAWRHVGRPWLEEGKPLWRSHWTAMLSFAAFGAALVYVAAGLLARDGARPFAFPLEGGNFVVGQGGGNVLLNHHSSHRAQRFAADITAVNAAGFRAAGLMPADPAGYVIFGLPVISPCDGEVVKAVDDLPDLNPPTMDRNNPAGNNVVLACGDARIELAHLRQGSVKVRQGDMVAVGQKLGEVGNSGNTTEPHLHVHAIDAETGEGVRMAFDGAIPVRNRMYRR